MNSIYRHLVPKPLPKPIHFWLTPVLMLGSIAAAMWLLKTIVDRL